MHALWKVLQHNVDIEVAADTVTISMSGESTAVERIVLVIGRGERYARIHWKHRNGHVNVWEYDLDLDALDAWVTTQSLGKTAWAIKRSASHEHLVDDGPEGSKEALIHGGAR